QKMKGSGAPQRKIHATSPAGNRLKGNYSVTILPCAAVSFKRCTMLKGERFRLICQIILTFAGL
uniref:hypothetical protein n=1 Tax=Candidatus Fimivicinus sp. TaxID=3056640 RepID=UPI003FEF11B4